jgi:hypothetical protein
VSHVTTRPHSNFWANVRWGEGVEERWHEWLADHQYELVSAPNLQAVQTRLLDEFCRAEDVRQSLKRMQPSSWAGSDIPETNQFVVNLTSSDGKGNVCSTTAVLDRTTGEHVLGRWRRGHGP